MGIVYEGTKPGPGIPPTALIWTIHLYRYHEATLGSKNQFCAQDSEASGNPVLLVNQGSAHETEKIRKCGRVRRIALFIGKS